MLKGVNRQVVEIHDTGNKCFEKAILFVNPEFSDVEMGALTKSLQRLVRSADVPKMSKRSRREALGGILSLLLSAAIGAVSVLLLVK